MTAGYSMTCASSAPQQSRLADVNAMMTGSAPNEMFGRAGNDFPAGERGNDRLDGGAGFDAGTGGYHDARIDFATSLERSDECDSFMG
jgi:hypothetical protein